MQIQQLPTPEFRQLPITNADWMMIPGAIGQDQISPASPSCMMGWECLRIHRHYRVFSIAGLLIRAEMKKVLQWRRTRVDWMSVNPKPFGLFHFLELT